MDPQTAQALRQIQTALAPALRRTLHLRRAQHVQEPAQRRLPHSAGSRTRADNLLSLLVLLALFRTPYEGSLIKGSRGSPY